MIGALAQLVLGVFRATRREPTERWPNGTMKVQLSDGKNGKIDRNPLQW